MKRLVFIFLLILFFISVIGCSSKTYDNNHTKTNQVLEEYEGKVTYYNKVKGNEENNLLIIDTEKDSITFAVLPDSKIIGNNIDVGTNVKIECIRESKDSTYRVATKIVVLEQ